MNIIVAPRESVVFIDEPVFVSVIDHRGCALILRTVIIKLVRFIRFGVPHSLERVQRFLDRRILADKRVDTAELHEVLKLLAGANNGDLYGLPPDPFSAAVAGLASEGLSVRLSVR